MRTTAWLKVATAVALFAVLPISTSGAQASGGPGADAIPTLDDIIIEGELQVPQVLFITARDQHRYDDFMYRAYLSTSLELARNAVLPAWIGLAPAPISVDLPDEVPEEEAVEGAGDAPSPPNE